MGAFQVLLCLFGGELGPIHIFCCWAWKSSVPFRVTCFLTEKEASQRKGATSKNVKSSVKNIFDTFRHFSR